MGDVKKWTVTYTKHVKQKRKVYQDGFLQIHSSSRKVMLYDDCETLLDSRFVKTDDIFRSGETLTFDAYLVDIGDLHGGHKPTTDLNFRGTDKKNNEKARSLHGGNFKSNSSSIGRKTSFGMKKASSINLSPSQKVIREFKKSEFSKYNTSQTCPDITKISVTGWQVLYTTQLTQKAKRFHDGILKIAINGLQTQAMLYDSTKRLLDSKFLKKDEVVRSGESLTFDGHLVEIGECEGEYKPQLGPKFQATNCNLVEKTGIQHGQQVQTHYNFPAEWEAMYTTQVTQKAKKYHSGILRLVSCGSYRMQAILLTEDGNTLGRKYFELSKEIRSGSTFELPNYLVEVGEQRKHPEREPQNGISQLKDKEGNVRSHGVDNILLSRRATARKLLHDGEVEKSTSALKDIEPYIRSSEAERFSKRLPANKPLRDAQSILSILRKPVTREGIATIKIEPVDSDGRSEIENFDVKDNKMDNCIDINTRSEAVHNDLFMEPINLSDSQPVIHNSSKFSFGSGAPNISRPADGESPVVESQVLDAPNSEPDGLELISSKAKSSLSSGESSEEVKPQKNFQAYIDNMEIDATSSGSCGFAIATSNDTSIKSCNVEEKNPEEEKHLSKEKNDEFPSFDLGF